MEGPTALPNIIADICKPGPAICCHSDYLARTRARFKLLNRVPVLCCKLSESQLLT